MVRGQIKRLGSEVSTQPAVQCFRLPGHIPPASHPIIIRGASAGVFVCVCGVRSMQSMIISRRAVILENCNLAVQTPAYRRVFLEKERWIVPRTKTL